MASARARLSIIARGVCTSGIARRETPNNLKGRKTSSQLWLRRQLADPYVEKAKIEKYRCRSAFKLLEMDERCGILSPGMTVVDCGASPGSWTQVAVHLTNAKGKQDGKPVGKVVAIDKLPIYPIDGAFVIGNMDFTTPQAQDKIREHLAGSSVDLVMSDMAPNATGVKEMDHQNIVALAYVALKFALVVSKPEASFIVKLWDGGAAKNVEDDIRKFYKTVKVLRPDATRTESSEKFLLAKGFKGLKVG
ncbi:rRNA methyltransferase 2, mitochondrial [Diprion similis]|uniref:rRNA methyltransferase 2, mitochondrial n=1 Tax=Diprion similis TaxID=362088 RepID=UPI001EF817FA|nr:rRNA methyltransferase 2, mitochondrial [Diprion similis]